MRTYFMGIGGVAMGNAALLGKANGETVLGTDGPIYSPMAEALAGLEIYQGYDAQRLAKLAPDTVVIGNSIGRGNTELEWFWEKKPFNYYCLPEYLYEKILKHRRTIAVCGTHGKTSTTAMTAYLLKNNAAPVGWLIGGVPDKNNLDSGAHLGPVGGNFVIEGDEYDCAFFDKRAKFIVYRPTAAVLNNLELDHTDIYRDIDDLKRAFSYMLRTIPANGIIIANADDENIKSIASVAWVKTLWVSGTDEKADLYIRNFTESENGSSFELVWRGTTWGRVNWALNGFFNARNAAMAALAAGWAINAGDPTQLKLESLSAFVGVKRRQQIRYKSESVVVVEDFGHHPTAVTLTLESLRNRYPHHKWVACLEPRSNTSRTNTHQDTFPVALAHADWSLIAPVYQIEKLAANKRLDTAKVAHDVKAAGKNAVALANCKDLPAELARILEKATEQNPIGVAFFTNGTFEGAMNEALQNIEATPAAR